MFDQFFKKKFTQLKWSKNGFVYFAFEFAVQIRILFHKIEQILLI